MRWGGARAEVPPDVWGEFERLTDPASADFILDLPDYYAFFTYSLFSGRVAE
jgi:demethylmenaquinone methyltransferase/2-methoxy-6-polyprenyl-1,4-benzoquinol methylase